MIAKLKSRKLWAAVVGTAIATLGNQLGMSPEVIALIITPITGYIIGQGIADHGARGKSQDS